MEKVYEIQRIKQVIQEVEGGEQYIVRSPEDGAKIASQFSAIWIMTILGLHSSLNSGMEFHFLLAATMVGIVIMLGYGILLLNLSNITRVADLPEPSQLVDVNSLHIGVPTLVLAAITSRVVLEKDPHGKGNLYLEIPHELPFINFTISAELELESNNQTHRNQLGNFSILEKELLIPLMNNLALTESITIICDLIFFSEQGFVDVIFKAELTNNSIQWKNYSNERYNTDANGYLNTKGEYVNIGESIYLYPKLYNQKIKPNSPLFTNDSSSARNRIASLFSQYINLLLKKND
jgi:hypothetical protein